MPCNLVHTLSILVVGEKLSIQFKLHLFAGVLFEFKQPFYFLNSLLQIM
jgi:hypothetical protein